MAHRLVEHPGELELELEASSAEDLFSAAAEAFAEIVDGVEPGSEPVRLDVALTGTDTALLLVDWLNELTYLAEVEAFVPGRVEELELAVGLRATVAGVRGRPRHLVKAATLNGLTVSHDGTVWRARAVLDV